MREHKYRAWLKQEQKMYEVNVIYFGVQYGMAPSDRVNLVDLRDKSEYYREGEEVDLLQYTGLKDCKGQEIYEGDIVRRGYFTKENDITKEIERWAVGSDISDWQKLSEGVRSNPGVLAVEVTGNIYEHPELLKGNNL